MGHSEKSALNLGMSAVPAGTDIRGPRDAKVAPSTGLKDRVIKVQTTLVASPGFGPIFELFARNRIEFGIGGFGSGI
jgi:hypothetical protein